MNIRIGSISKILTPSYSACQKCDTTWAFVKPHCTDYEEGKGCFPLCEKCWNELTPEERLPYYRMLWNIWSYWNKQNEEKWIKINKAVLEGK